MFSLPPTLTSVNPFLLVIATPVPSLNICTKNRAPHLPAGCLPWIQQPLWGRKQSSFVHLLKLLNSSSFGSHAWLNVDLFAGRHPLWNMAQALCVRGAQWKALMHLGASVEEVMLYQNWTENAVFWDDSTLFRYFVFTGQYTYIRAKTTVLQYSFGNLLCACLRYFSESCVYVPFWTVL